MLRHKTPFDDLAWQAVRFCEIEWQTLRNFAVNFRKRIFSHCQTFVNAGLRNLKSSPIFERANIMYRTTFFTIAYIKQGFMYEMILRFRF